MNKIGFKNFRRFIDFQPIEYAGISFLVGRNNSGKSTVVKALLLVIDYLKSGIIRSFSFNENNIEDVNITTYSRAKSKHSTTDYIAFKLVQENLEINLIVSGKDDSTAIDVNTVEIIDLQAGFRYFIKPEENSILIANTAEINTLDNQVEIFLLAELRVKEKELVKNLKNIGQKTSAAYIQANEELISIKKKLLNLKRTIRKNEVDGHFDLDMHYTGETLPQIFEEAIVEFSAEYDIQYHDIQRGKKPRKNFEALKAFKDNRFKIEKSIADILQFQTLVENVYLGATLNKQSALFAIRDKKNALAQAIHEYKQLGIDKDQGSEAYKFVAKWIQEKQFEIGESFEINMYAGEAYEVIISTKGIKVHLADKGMGSIQSMLLILRLATIIYKKYKNNKSYTVIIEEPELNLHPALQSKLADLFHEVYTNFQINFIVETHSEYLIRKTQLIVKDNEYEIKPNTNPFTIIYFDQDTTQWHMNYRGDGKFIDEFGSGFFDETRNIVKQLI